MVRGSLRPVLTTGGHSGLRAALNLGRRPEPSMQPLSAFLGCALTRLGQDAREQPRALLAAQKQQARTCDQALSVQYPRRRITGEITRDRNASRAAGLEVAPFPRTDPFGCVARSASPAPLRRDDSRPDEARSASTRVRTSAKLSIESRGGETSWWEAAAGSVIQTGRSARVRSLALQGQALVSQMAAPLRQLGQGHRAGLVGVQ